MSYGEKQYRFAAIADVHIDLENGGKNIYFVHAEKNFRKALDVIRQHDCAFVVNVGDVVTNASGAEEEWRLYRDIIESSGYGGQIFEAMGNHETRFAQYGGCSIAACRDEFIRYTRLSQKPVQRPDGKTYYAYTDDTFGDAFIFLSLENGVNTNEIDNFSAEQMDWAEETILRFRREKRRIFLLQHAPLYGCGTGDDKTAPAYEGSIRLTDRQGKPFPGNSRFDRLIHEYRDLIWLSGHTHLDFRDKRNCSVGGTDTCRMLHIPALAGSTRLLRTENGYTLDRTFYDDAAQGYIADAFEDRVIFRGIDFLSGRFYPAYEYLIDR